MEKRQLPCQCTNPECQTTAGCKCQYTQQIKTPPNYREAETCEWCYYFHDDPYYSGGKCSKYNCIVSGLYVCDNIRIEK